MKTALDELDELAEQIGNSQRFGQLLPAEVTKRWAARINQLTASLRGTTDAGAERAEAERSGVNSGKLPVDFTVMPKYSQCG